MNLFYGDDINLITGDIKRPVAATIGFFDGLHVGHKFLIKRLVSISKERGYESMVITFSNHPRLVFSTESDLKLLSTGEEKRNMISNYGVDYCLMLRFTKEFATMTSGQFMEVLAERFHVKLLLVGYDHHFGSDVRSGFDDYKRYGAERGVEVLRMKPVVRSGLTVSSSKIRKALMNGDISLANSMLGYNYSVTGCVVKGNQIGRSIGFPTANLYVDKEKLPPKCGVYAVWVEVCGCVYPGMMNIGSRPTVGGDKVTFEVNIIGYEGDIYGEFVCISFVAFIRDEIKFESIELLRKQLEKDKEKVLSILSN